MASAGIPASAASRIARAASSCASLKTAPVSRNRRSISVSGIFPPLASAGCYRGAVVVEVGSRSLGGGEPYRAARAAPVGGFREQTTPELLPNGRERPI